MEQPSSLQKIKPRSARAARALKAREPQARENPKTPLFLQYTSASRVVTLLLGDLHTLKKPAAIRFHKKNAVRPFEDAASLEFFAEKNDASLFVYGSHSKKRPHALTLVRMFQHRVLDMLELLVDPDSMRTLGQFKNRRKATVGLKPLLCFSGAAFDSPSAPPEYALAKSLFADLFKGPDMEQVDVEGLQYILSFSVGEVTAETPRPRIHLRSYLVRTRRSGQRLPRVELEEMGPRADFNVGRMRAPDPDMLREAMKRPKTSEPRARKNVTTDLIGDKMGRIHIGRQDLKSLQTRKMKGLKRDRDVDVDGAPESNGHGHGLESTDATQAGHGAKRTKV